MAPRISTATTLGGGVDGIGFDGRGLGEGVSLISTYESNDDAALLASAFASASATAQQAATSVS